MSDTIKINEFADKPNLTVSDMLAVVEDSTNTNYKTTLNKLQTFLNTIGVIGIKGVIDMTSIAPTEDGIYLPTQDGTYTNFGGEVISLDDNFVVITVFEGQTEFTQISYPITLTGYLQESDKATEIARGNTGLAISGDVYRFRYEQYPFKEGQFTYSSSTDIYIPEHFKYFQAVYQNGLSKLTDRGTVRRFQLKGAGNDGAGNYYIRIRRENTTYNNFAEDRIEVAISSVTDETNVVFTNVHSSELYTYTLVVDFTLLKNESITINNPDGFSEFSPLCMKELAEISTTPMLNDEKAINSDSVFRFRHNQFPFKENLFPYNSSTGLYLPDSIKDFKATYKNPYTRFTTSGTVRRFQLKGAGNDGLGNYYIRIRRENNTKGSFSEDRLEIAITDVVDETSVIFTSDTEFRSYYVECDFTLLKNEDFFIGTPSGFSDFQSHLIVDDSYKLDLQTMPINHAFTQTLNLEKNFKNQLDSDDAIPNLSYSWWCNPIAYTNSANKSRLSAVHNTGSQVYYEEEQGNTSLLNLSTEKVYYRDEHNTAAFLELSTGDYIAAYTGHNQDDKMRVRLQRDEIDSNFSDFSDLGYTYETVIDFSSFLTYTQLIENNGKVYIFTRVGGSKWQWTVSEDFGKTWSTPKDLLVQGGSNYNRIYILTKITTGTNWLKVYNYLPIESDDENRLGYFAIDLNTMNAYDKENGTLICDLNAEGVGTDECKVLYNAPTGERIRFLDACGGGATDAVFTVANFDIATGDIGNYRLVNYDLSTDTSVIAELPSHGGFFTHTYLGGAYIQQDVNGASSNPFTVYISRNDGGTWKIEKYTVNGTTVTLDALIDSSTTDKLVRPLPPMGASNGTGVEIFYIKGQYENNSYLEFHTKIISVNF